jgi:cytochrome o ubiquinol oxidase subunit 2
MLKKFRFLPLIIFLIGFAALLLWLSHGHTVAVLEPKGHIASQQRNLLVFATVLSLFVIVPVYILTIFIIWKYRAGNTKATYTPDWDNHKRLETIWWGIPCVIILILSVVAWRSSHALDPFRPIASSQQPLTIQVVALQWKWLFIYPEQGIASVNYVAMPVGRPVDFEITADAPMNSFWIPQLGGQMYAMSGMKTHLHLVADSVGTYSGSSANMSGEGFAGMKFAVGATTAADFDSWVLETKNGTTSLDTGEYTTLARPGSNAASSLYARVDPKLYDTIVMNYMMPTSGQHADVVQAGHSHN